MRIRWGTGYMEIDLDKFFPASLVKLRRLLKIIQLDWEHGDSLLDDLKTHFSEKIAFYSEADEKPGIVKKYERLLEEVNKWCV